jgi:hypothetical protein
MKWRLILVIGIGALVILGTGGGPNLIPVRASSSFQAADTATPTATGTAAAATATSTATAAAATATSTATSVPATATATGTATAAPTATTTATAAAATATTTATATPAATTTATVPLAAYPAPVMAATTARHGRFLVFQWYLYSRTGVKGFNLYAGKHKLNSHLIATHRSSHYQARVLYRQGKRSIQVLYRNGTHRSLPVS